MALKARFERSDGFKAAWADYGLSGKSLELLEWNLARRPTLGKPGADDPGIRRYRFRDHIVSYAIIDREFAKGEVIFWLLDLTPVADPPSTLGRFSGKMLVGITWIARIWRGNYLGGNDDE